MNNEQDRTEPWTREDIEKALKDILMDALGVEESKIVPDASLMNDLGAESIDILDIGFRIQQKFGVELPNRAIQETVLNWRNLSELTRLFQEKYKVQLGHEDVARIRSMGIQEALAWLAQNRKITIANGDAEGIAEDLVQRLVDEIETMGFKASLVDAARIKSLLLESLGSPQIVEGLLRLFSVGALTDFIAARVGAERA
jgi:acyl carrier protein